MNMEKKLEVMVTNDVKHRRYATINAPETDAHFFEGTVNGLKPLAQVKEWARKKGYSQLVVMSMHNNEDDKIYNL